jgi:hypothetical protein
LDVVEVELEGAGLLRKSPKSDSNQGQKSGAFRTKRIASAKNRPLPTADS